MKEWLTLNLDGTDRQVPADLWRIWLQPGKPEPGVFVQVEIDPAAPLRWEELDRLPRLVEIHYTGRDPRILSYVATRRAVQRLEWSHHGLARIDVKDSDLVEFSTHCTDGALALVLPESLTRLVLAVPPGPERVSIAAAEQGARIHLTQVCGSLPDGPTAIAGLERLQSLSLFGVRRVDLLALLPYRELEELSIAGPRGAIAGIESLADFPKLRKIALRECYDLAASQWPPRSAFPALECVEINGVARTDAAIMAQRLAGLPALTIRGKRTDAWLAANLDNPFREWADEYGASVGRLALSTYRKALSALTALPGDSPADAARPALREFVEAFNKLDTRHDVDTIMREEIGDVFHELAERLPQPPPSSLVAEWFDEWREF